MRNCKSSAIGGIWHGMIAITGFDQEDMKQTLSIEFGPMIFTSQPTLVTHDTSIATLPIKTKINSQNLCDSKY